MKEITKTFPNKIHYDLSKLGNIKKILFFDIETTGLSPKNSNLYLIGCMHITSNHTVTFKQWFAESLKDEISLLQSFYNYASQFNTLIHFNGDGFDLPYIKECAKQYYLFDLLENYKSIDIYKIIRYLKKPLGLPHMNQKSLEEYLGLHRTDIYDGGTLIEFYFKYLQSKEKHLLDFLLLHNEEDILGMLKVLDMLTFVDFFNSDFTLSSHKITESALILDFISNEFLNCELNFDNEISIYIYENHMTLSIPILCAELKYFFANYKDYYYLTIEDYAIHKSIGIFVDRAVKKKATKQTAYVKKLSCYIPCFNINPICETFKKEYTSKKRYIDLSDLDYNNKFFFKNYAMDVLKHFKLLKQ